MHKYESVGEERQVSKSREYDESCWRHRGCWPRLGSLAHRNKMMVRNIISGKSYHIGTSSKKSVLRWARTRTAGDRSNHLWAFVKRTQLGCEFAMPFGNLGPSISQGRNPFSSSSLGSAPNSRSISTTAASVRPSWGAAWGEQARWSGVRPLEFRVFGSARYWRRVSRRPWWHLEAA